MNVPSYIHGSAPDEVLADRVGSLLPLYCGGVGHGVETSDPGGAEPGLGQNAVESVASTLQALATPSRLRILLHLRGGACSVGEIAVAVAMEQSAVSHQLRILRHLGLVVGDRHGRQINYRLYDGHVAQLLHEAVYHVEHLRLGPADTSTTTAALGREPSAP